MSSNRLAVGIAAFFVLAFGALGYVYYSWYAQLVEDAKHIRLEKSETRAFQLVEVNPPKHFYVDIKDVETGATNTDVYVSKHCNSWRETAVVGNTYRIVVEKYRDDRNGVQSVKYKDLYEVFCDQT